MTDFGPTRRWLEGDILYTKNDFVQLAWARTDDPAKVGKLGYHGPQQVIVEYIDPDTWALNVREVKTGL